ncbi:MAG: hypothetical protein FJ271_06935 [Planctomycetes bacterium]|nr:hypothetical protein [Planctomycetota bacterium]
MQADPDSSAKPPAAWAIGLAFALVYISWGTTYLATQKGVRDEQLPPALFGGTRVCLAGALLLVFLALRREAWRLPASDVRGIALSALFLFVGGNGLINFAERTVNSGLAAVIAATTPLWVGVMEMISADGEKLNGRGWLGLIVGLGGVVLLLGHKLQQTSIFGQDVNLLLVLGSAWCWAAGSIVLRRQRLASTRLAGAAWQMVLGGGVLAFLGVLTGEVERLPEQWTATAVSAFLYLLIVGSLIGFVSFNWLLAHVSTSRVSTYAYVNPVIAVLVGWLAGEETNAYLGAGILIILTGVALVRSGGSSFKARHEESA